MLDRLDATDDAVQCRCILAVETLARGAHTEAEDLLADVETIVWGRPGLRSATSTLVRAELAQDLPMITKWGAERPDLSVRVPIW